MPLILIALLIFIKTTSDCFALQSPDAPPNKGTVGSTPVGISIILKQSSKPHSDIKKVYYTLWLSNHFTKKSIGEFVGESPITQEGVRIDLSPILKDSLSSVKYLGMTASFVDRNNFDETTVPVKCPIIRTQSFTPSQIVFTISSSSIVKCHIEHLPIKNSKTTADSQKQTAIENLELEQDLIDMNYKNYIMTIFGRTYNPNHEILIDPKVYLSTYRNLLNTTDSKLTINPGKYASPAHNITPWLYHDAGNKTGFFQSGQGWKIHITAQPKSALLIAKLVLSHLSQKYHNSIHFKVMRSIPQLRRLWYLSPYMRGQETQAGKFLVLYPRNINEARQLISELDQILMKAREEKLLTESDFLPLIGDAKVGISGGIYVRYGKFSQGSLTLVGPDYSPVVPSHDHEAKLYSFLDDRTHPWPDFMNKGNLLWRDAENPFEGLNLRWQPSPSSQMISWDNRPLSWSPALPLG